MRLGPRERVALRGARASVGSRQARARAEGFRPSGVARPRQEAHERARGGDALLRHAPSLGASRPARLRSASRRRRGACSSLLCTRKRRRSSRVSPPRPRPGDRRRRNRRLSLQMKPRASGAGGRAPAGIDSSRHCAHASFVLQKSVGRCRAQRSARRRARGAKPLARASDPRGRGPSAPRGLHARAWGRRGARRGGGASERGGPHHVSAIAIDQG